VAAIRDAASKDNYTSKHRLSSVRSTADPIFYGAQRVFAATKSNPVRRPVWSFTAPRAISSGSRNSRAWVGQLSTQKGASMPVH